MYKKHFIKSVLMFCLMICSLSTSAKSVKPNIIVIFTDDLGYGDVSCYGATGYETPEIDKMAEQGMKFTDFTVAHCICTPSRAGLLTGRHPERWGYKGGVYFPYHNDGMPASEITIAEVLKQKNYKTGIVGKWHLGHKKAYLPLNQGFDYYFGIPYSNDMWQDGREAVSANMIFNKGLTIKDYKSTNTKNKEVIKKNRGKVPYMRNNDIVEWPVDQASITKRFTKESVEFIKDNKDNPFFLYIAHSMPHVPLYASEKFKGKTERGIFGDVIEEIDWSVGEILKTLKDLGIAENTLVIFTSDNGPWLIKKDKAGNAGKLRGGKFTTYEGGQRVPCVMWWPETIPAGKVSKHHISSLDFLPTFAKLAGAKLPKKHKLDGLNVLPTLKGKSKAPKRKFYLYGKGEAVRIGNWKYRKGGVSGMPYGNKDKTVEVQLFNLEQDPEEKNNLASKYPKKVAEMAELLKTEYENLKK